MTLLYSRLRQLSSHRIFSGIFAFLLGIFLCTQAEGATRSFTERFSSNSNGDIYLIGNTAMTCNGGCAQQTGAGNNGTLTMVYVDIDGDGTSTQSSSATLSLPAGSTVLWAGLYWQADSNDVNRGTVLFKTPSSAYQTITASQVDFVTGQGCGGNCTTVDRYGAFADVTNMVANGGNGSYTVANIKGSPNNQNTYGGWGLVVVFQNNTLPLRNLTVFDGYQDVTTNANGNPTPNPNVFIPVAGFLTPYSGPVSTTIGVIAGEGDRGTTGDNFRLNGVGLVDPLRVANDFFSSYISDRGALVTAKNPNYSNQLGWDIGRVNASNILANGATSATINLNTNGDWYYASAVSFVTDLYVPIIVPNVNKTGVDVNGGNLVPGDILRYTISMNNTGYDAGTNLSVIDNIPPYTSYVPGSLRIITGPAGAPTGVMTDPSGDDAAEYIASGTPRVVFRLGSGANAINGGTLAQGQSTSLSFDVQLSSTIPAGTILTNSAQISYSGQTLGAVYAAASSAAASAIFVPPTVAKTFTPQVVATSAGTTTLSIVFTNPASNLGAVTGVAVTDTYPAGLINATPANPSLTCTAGSTPGSIVGGVAGGNTIGMTGTTIAQNGSCTLSVTVKGTSDGIFTNNLPQVTTTNAGNTSTPSATATFSVGRPAITKAFSTASIPTGNNATITFTLTNPTGVAMTGANFTDTYPAGLVNATPLTLGGTCAGRAVDGATVAGSGVFNLTSATIPATGSCTVTVLVTSSTAGSYDNTTSGVTTTQTPTAGAPSNTANLLVYAPVTATKAFTPASVSTGGTSQLAITVTNPNPAGMPAVTGAAFTDTYPANVVNTTAPNPVITCTAGSSATLVGGAASGNTIGMSGGIITGGGSCTITVFVTSATANTYTDNADTITTTNAGNGTVPAATLNVSALTPPGATKAFTGPIARNQTSTMTLTLTNSNGSAITGVSFTDTYPAGLVNTAAPGGATTCGGGTVTAAAGGTSLILSDGTIPATGNCTVTVNVTSATADTYYNNTGLITTGNAGVGAGANGNLLVLAPPVITKAFGTNPVALNTPSKMTITLTNPASNTASLAGVAFTDTFPANNAPNGMKVAPTPNLANTCGGTVTGGAAGNTSLGLSNVTLAANGSCSIAVDVIGATADNYVNSTGTVTSTNAGDGNAAAATLSVGLPGIAKSFGTSPILAGATSVMTVTLSNPTGAPMTAAAFTDTYPAGMTNTGAPGGATTCAGGTVTAAANGGSVSLSGGTIPANGSCTVTVNVTATVTGTNTIAAGTLTVSGGASNVNPASAILQVTPPPVATKTFSPNSIPTSAGTVTSTLTITITNPTSNTINGVAFTDTYPSANLDNSVASTISCTAGSSGTRTGGAGASTVGMTGGTLLGNGSCTVTVPVYSNTAATYNNTTGPITSTNGGTGQPATDTLTVLAPFTAAKTFSPAAINAAPDNTTLTVTLTNPNATAAVTGVAFTDTYPAGLTNVNPLTVSTTCGGTVTATAGGNSLALSGGTIPANSSCTVSVLVESTAGNKTNPAFTVTSTNDGNAAVAAAALTLVAYTSPGVTKSFAAAQTAVGTSTTMTITLTNPNSGAGNRDITGTAFTDNLPTEAGGGQMRVAAGAQTNTCGGTLTAVANSTSISLAGGTIPEAGSCQITVPVTSAASGTYVNTINAVTSTNAATGGPASATLVVVLVAPTATKAFTPALVGVNDPSTLTITLTNPNGTDITGANFSDAYPAGIVNSGTPSEATTCPGGTVTVAAGGNSLVLTGATIPASGSCTATVGVTATTPGSLVNNTGSIFSSNALTGGSVSGTLTVVAQPSLVFLKSADKATAVPGEVITYSLLVTNSGAGSAINVIVEDRLSPFTAFGLGTFTLQEGVPASGITLGTAVYSNDNGSTWTYTPVSGGGGAPAGYDGNVTNWRMPMTGTMTGSNGNFTLKYNVTIK